MKLGAPLDGFLVRKLGFPGREELAMGALASDGVRVLNAELLRTLAIPDDVIDAAAAKEGQELVRRERAYRSDRPPPDVAGRIVLLVDDGQATGSTMRAAAMAMRPLHPARVVAAVPVGLAEISPCWPTRPTWLCAAGPPEPFHAVGIWYEDFTQTTDEEVRDLLERAAAISGRGKYAPPNTSSSGGRSAAPYDNGYFSPLYVRQRPGVGRRRVSRAGGRAGLEVHPRLFRHAAAGGPRRSRARWASARDGSGEAPVARASRNRSNISRAIGRRSAADRMRSRAIAPAERVRQYGSEIAGVRHGLEAAGRPHAGPVPGIRCMPRHPGIPATRWQTGPIGRRPPRRSPGRRRAGWRRRASAPEGRGSQAPGPHQSQRTSRGAAGRFASRSRRHVTAGASAGPRRRHRRQSGRPHLAHHLVGVGLVAGQRRSETGLAVRAALSTGHRPNHCTVEHQRRRHVVAVE